MEVGLIAVGVAVGVGVVLSVLKSRYDGRFRTVRARPAHDSVAPDLPDVSVPHDGVRRNAAEDAPVLDERELGGPLGERATLVQFSSAFCAPCRATHRILADVVGMVDGVKHVELDAESNLDLVRRLDVMRTPTVLVLDAEGGLVTRASGQPRKADVIAALGKAVEPVSG